MIFSFPRGAGFRVFHVTIGTAAIVAPEMDDREIGELYRQCGAMIYRRCCKLLGDGAAAQDATQDVFVRFMTEVHRLRPDGGYLPWIYRVATNHCLNRLRDDARLTVMEPRAMPEPTTDGAIAGFAGRDLSARLLQRVDGETRDNAVLVLVDGLTQDEVAEVLGLSRKTVGKKLRRFLERARRFLREAA